MKNNLFFPKNDSIASLPKVIDIELTNRCNFRCLMCPSGTLMSTRPKGMMSDKIYYYLLEQAVHYKIPIRFIRWGEPTLHPKFLIYLKAAKHSGLSCHINTNGSLLRPIIIEELIKNLDSIKFSFQGVDRNSFQEMRNRDFFDELIKIIILFHELRGKKTMPFINIGTSITNETNEQVNNFKNLVSPFVDSVIVTRTVLEHIDIDNPNLSHNEKKKIVWLKQFETVIKIHPKCTDINNVMAINYDGTVSACCRDYDNKLIVGDTNKDTIQQIWNGNEFNSYRNLINNNKQDSLPICRYCYDNKDILL